MNQNQIRQWFIDWGQACIDNKQYLSDLDNAIGDGDHGFNMAKAFVAYFETLEKKEISSVADEFKTLAMTLLSKVGGTAGPIYASAFLTMSKALTDVTEVDADLMVDLFKQGLDAIQSRGKAQVGEKTLVDVWAPAIDQLRNNELTNDSVDALVEATAPLKATKGRASYLGERSIGHIDPGSMSSGYCFKAYLNNHE